MTIKPGFALFSQSLDVSVAGVAVPIVQTQLFSVPLPTHTDKREMFLTFAAGDAQINPAADFDIVFEFWELPNQTGKPLATWTVSSKAASSPSATAIAFSLKAIAAANPQGVPTILNVVWHATAPGVSIASTTISLNGVMFDPPDPAAGTSFWGATLNARVDYPVLPDDPSKQPPNGFWLGIPLQATTHGGNTIVIVNTGAISNKKAQPGQLAPYRMKLRLLKKGVPVNTSFFKNWDVGVFAQQDMLATSQIPMIGGGFYVADTTDMSVRLEIHSDVPDLFILTGTPIASFAIQEINHDPFGEHLVSYVMSVQDTDRPLDGNWGIGTGIAVQASPGGILNSLALMGGIAPPAGRMKSDSGTTFLRLFDLGLNTLAETSETSLLGPSLTLTTQVSSAYAVSVGALAERQGEAAVLKANSSAFLAAMYQPP